MFDSIISWFTGLFATFYDWLVSLLPDWMGSGWSDLASAFGPTAQYLAYLGGLDVVAPTIVAAYVVRFSIRRIPFIG